MQAAFFDAGCIFCAQGSGRMTILGGNGMFIRKIAIARMSD